MAQKLFNFNCGEELIKKIDGIVDDSKNKYKDRTQFLILAIQEKLVKEGRQGCPRCEDFFDKDHTCLKE